jgi:hypothetical protein
MNKVVWIGLLLALGLAARGQAQADIERYDSEFMGGANDRDEERHGSAASIEEAKRTGHGYRIGTQPGGSPNGAVGGDPATATHLVKPGDTLWRLSEQYYGQPWHWPQLWSYNPEITNPHWIYPLDHVRLSAQALEAQAAADKIKADVESGVGPGEPPPTAGVIAGTETAPPVVVPGDAWVAGMILLRDQGYLDTDTLRTAGQIVSANEEHMMMSPSDQIYIRFAPATTPRVGESFTLFRTIDPVERIDGGFGTLVRIQGTAAVRTFDSKTRIARAVITESLEPIERGMLAAKLDRRFDLVAPKKNQANVKAKIVATVQPRSMIGFDNVVFLDVGEGRGIQPGNRFVAVRKGDRFLGALDTDPMNVGNIVEVPEYDPDLLPDEVYGELVVLKVRKHTTIALVTRSDSDIPLGADVEMRAGF